MELGRKISARTDSTDGWVAGHATDRLINRNNAHLMETNSASMGRAGGGGGLGAGGGVGAGGDMGAGGGVGAGGIVPEVQLDTSLFVEQLFLR